jgi:hypothetical protein
MVLHLDNPTLALRPNAAISVVVHESTDSRSAFDAVIAGRSLGGTLYQPNPIPVSSLRRDAKNNVSVILGLAGSGIQPTIGLDDPGVYPVEVSLTNTGVATQSFVTWLVTVDTRSENPIGNKLGISFIWQLVADPARMPDGTTDPSVLRELQPGGRLDRIATLLARTSGFDASLIVSPETVESWRRLAQDSAELAPGFTRVRNAVAKSSVALLPAPYVVTDERALEAAGFGAALAGLQRHGTETLRSTLGVDPSANAQVAFVDPASETTIDRLRAELVDRVVVRDESLAPVTHPFTPAQTFVVGTEGGRSRAASTAPFLEDLLNGPASSALKAQRVIAAIAEVAYETPAISRGLIVAPPARWNPDLKAMTIIVDGLRNNPLVEPMHLDEFFSTVSNEQVRGLDVERRLQPMVAPATPISAADYGQAISRLEAFRQVVGTNDPAVKAGEQALLVALSTAMSPERARSELGKIDAAVRSFTSGISTDAKRVTLTAKRARVPLSFMNALDPPRDVTVRVHLGSTKLVFPAGADQVVTLKPGNNTIQFDVEARASGTFPMTIGVTSPDGGLEFGAPVRVTVRSAVFGGYAVALTVAALIFLALWWANHLRKTRRGRPIAHTPAPAT